ncbi:hypothetical protein G6L26_007520 [Agrobacterium radiobacter]|uniref:Uncharacterized protein n=1 Tax=Agrobacterium tumefaciens str. B6 TaxID=1183423 RepID=A0A822UYC1_AGRTU|nr:hypothetical protein [Agrobacterium tumefaciens]MQB28175.1 hypothetical protein [Agrobacterium tumefaciens]NTA05020.1 hypothetical protein [Agrobacterium tumefaciens]NTA91615.1 hypothetical protein [Agrobacterium tumefaciens]NTB12765.1 hypothetical protein [Agrobacterium tumefaciens]OCJ38389.1 hypothetical protein A6U90_22685 [Agrobacterium tumefaciens]
MLNIEHLIKVAEAYGSASQVEEKTVSSRVFQDSKKLGAIRAGSDITVGRYNAAILWFDANWPEGADWPHDVPRPLTADRFDAMFGAGSAA